MAQLRARYEKLEEEVTKLQQENEKLMSERVSMKDRVNAASQQRNGEAAATATATNKNPATPSPLPIVATFYLMENSLLHAMLDSMQAKLARAELRSAGHEAADTIRAVGARRYEKLLQEQAETLRRQKGDAAKMAALHAECKIGKAVLMRALEGERKERARLAASRGPADADAGAEIKAEEKVSVRSNETEGKEVEEKEMREKEVGEKVVEEKEVEKNEVEKNEAEKKEVKKKKAEPLSPESPEQDHDKSGTKSQKKDEEAHEQPGEMEPKPERDAEPEPEPEPDPDAEPW